jgi:phosphatidylglycerol:prolipoprotein diacylglycerol transferase
MGAGALYGRHKFGAMFPGITDIISPVIPLFHFFGRIGCFMAGCCFGIESGFGFTFTRSLIAEANGVRRFPVQLLEALFNLGLFCILHIQREAGAAGEGSSGARSFPASLAKSLKGKLLFLYLLLYPAGRFILECIRGDAYRGIWGPFSVSQWISLALIAFSLFKLLGNKNTSKAAGG